MYIDFYVNLLSFDVGEEGEWVVCELLCWVVEVGVVMVWFELLFFVGDVVEVGMLMIL